MKICCLSDLHGHFPDVPDCYLLLLAGDYAPAWKHHPVRFHSERLVPWVFDCRQRMEVVAVAGNHDLLFEEHPQYATNASWKYLHDSGCEVGGLKIWGSPWQPTFGQGWAFNLDESQLADKWALIPDDTDILLLHGPPRGYGDYSPFGNEHCGSPSLLQRIVEIKPRLVVSGHIHSGNGVRHLGRTTIVNASYVNEQYRPAFPPLVIEI